MPYYDDAWGFLCFKFFCLIHDRETQDSLKPLEQKLKQVDVTIEELVDKIRGHKATIIQVRCISIHSKKSSQY